MKTYMPMVERRGQGVHFPQMYEIEGGHWVPAEVAKRLYEALEAYHNHFGILEDNSFVNEEARRCCHMARAALAKARGDES